MEDVLTEKKESHDALISRLIKNGSVKAHNHLCLIFERAHDIEKNLDRAIFNFEKISEQDHPEGNYYFNL